MLELIESQERMAAAMEDGGSSKSGDGLLDVDVDAMIAKGRKGDFVNG